MRHLQDYRKVRQLQDCHRVRQLQDHRMVRQLQGCRRKNLLPDRIPRLMKLIVVPVALVCFLMGCQSAAEQPAEQPESAAPDGESRFTFSEDATSLTILESGEP